MSEWDYKERRKPMNDEEMYKFAEAFGAVLKRNEKRAPFGLSSGDMIKMVAFGILVISFYIRTNDAMTRLIQATDYLSAHAKNSDAYHSAATGVAFEQGKPLGGFQQVFPNAK